MLADRLPIHRFRGEPAHAVKNRLGLSLFCGSMLAGQFGAHGQKFVHLAIGLCEGENREAASLDESSVTLLKQEAKNAQNEEDVEVFETFANTRQQTLH